MKELDISRELARKNLLRSIENYTPNCEQERRDKEIILSFLHTYSDAFERSNNIAHMTASAWTINFERTKALMVYHNIYRSWSWTGGHADGDPDLLKVALRECREETGLSSLRPIDSKIFSLEILTVDGHEKRGIYVPSHLHMNITYLLEADDTEELSVCELENRDVSWFSREEVCQVSMEPWIVERIYKKLNNKLTNII